MNPNLGRFVSRDTYDGTVNNPITQNHYVYGNGNPGRFVDPSGKSGRLVIAAAVALKVIFQYAKNEIKEGIVSQMFNYMDIVFPDEDFSGGRISIVGAQVYTLFALYLSKKNKKGQKKSNTKQILPVVNYGWNMPYHTSHIFRSTLGIKKIGLATPNVLEYKKYNNSEKKKFRDYINEQEPCIDKPSGWICDEYPFNSTKQSGVENGETKFEESFKKVTTKAVPKAESDMQMQLMGQFYQDNYFYTANQSKKGKFKHTFLVNSGLPFTVYVTYYLYKKKVF